MVGHWRTTHDAEHGWEEIGTPGQAWAATFFVPSTAFGRAEVGVVAAAACRLLPDGARVFRFPGSDALPASLTVAELLATTSIEEVVALGGGRVHDQQVVRTQQFLRPVTVDGRLRLQVRPAADATLVGFEQPNPTPCCADH